MSYFVRPSRLLTAVAGTIALLAVGTVNAATLQLDFGHSFGDPLDPDTAAPAGPAPWLTAVFDDGDTVGSVTLTLTVSGDVGGASITGVYLNIADAIGAGSLSISHTGGQASDSINASTDAYKADADGLYDILIGFANNSFTAGESSIFSITATDLVAQSFNVLATPDDINGPFYGAAKFQSTGDGSQSDWVGVVPVPAAAWFFGSALGLLGWMRRKTA